MASDVILPIRFPSGEIAEVFLFLHLNSLLFLKQAGINIRPWARECLQELSQLFEIIIFTASHSCYASVVLDYLDPKREWISHRLFRDHCVQTEEGMYVKDLRVLGQRNLQDVLIIDNAAYSFGYHVDNGIPCIPFYDNKADQQLKHFIVYAKYLASIPDIVAFNREYFKLFMYTEEATPEALFQKLKSK